MNIWLLEQFTTMLLKTYSYTLTKIHFPFTELGETYMACTPVLLTLTLVQNSDLHSNKKLLRQNLPKVSTDIGIHTPSINTLKCHLHPHWEYPYPECRKCCSLPSGNQVYAMNDCGLSTDCQIFAGGKPKDLVLFIFLNDRKKRHCER